MRMAITRIASATFAIRVVLLAMLAGCSTGSSPKKAQFEQPGVPIVWPAPPDEPRIAFVQDIRHPGDVGIKRSALTRFARWVIGSDEAKEQFAKPFGIALDENGNLCVTDTGVNAVSYWDRTRRKWYRWDKLGKNFYFSSPVSVAKQNGIFYVADSGLGSIVAFDEEGKLRFQITQKLERPTGLTISGDTLYVVDSQRHNVVKYDLQGQFLGAFGGRGVGGGQFNFPTHIAADGNGNLFVTDSMNSRVQVLDRDGNFKSQIGSIGDSPGEFSRPKGVATDSHGHVYVLDALFDSMQVFDRDGRLLLNFAQAGSAPGQFWMPNGVAISRNNEIFVADSYNRRVQQFKYIGKP
jgi:sugar lactone lactonase YvrE